MNRQLLRPFSKEDVRVSLFSVHPSKALSLYGYPTGFFQKFWNKVGDSITYVCLNILNEDENLNTF